MPGLRNSASFVNTQGHIRAPKQIYFVRQMPCNYGGGRPTRAIFEAHLKNTLKTLAGAHNRRARRRTPEFSSTQPTSFAAAAGPRTLKTLSDGWETTDLDGRAQPRFTSGTRTDGCCNVRVADSLCSKNCFITFIPADVASLGQTRPAAPRSSQGASALQKVMGQGSMLAFTRPSAHRAQLLLCSQPLCWHTLQPHTAL